MDDNLHLVPGALNFINITVWRKLSDKEQRHTIVTSCKGVIQQAASHPNRKKALRNSACSREVSKYKCRSGGVSLAVVNSNPWKCVLVCSVAIHLSFTLCSVSHLNSFNRDHGVDTNHLSGWQTFPGFNDNKYICYELWLQMDLYVFFSGIHLGVKWLSHLSGIYTQLYKKLQNCFQSDFIVWYLHQQLQ